MSERLASLEGGATIMGVPPVNPPVISLPALSLIPVPMDRLRAKVPSPETSAR
ncbi:hypothetical protein [Ensifer sp. ENS02]|uniref:hypothetical protein n=1 Tax=Ensifer sp. ENS02 TaxID=2769290 RepID=UPI001AEE2689|nr:hypothetical protein [Ensifer sp. ENS02]